MNAIPRRDRLVYLLLAIIILMGIEIVYLLIQNYALKAIVRDPEKYFKTLSKDDSVPSFTAQDIDGNDVSVMYSAGEPHTIIFWFAPTCDSCEENVSFWKRIYGEYNSENLRFIGMFAGSTGEARKYVSKHGFEFPVVSTKQRYIVESYRGNVLPQTMLIAPEGVIRGVWPGVLSEGIENEIVESLEALTP